MKVSVGKNIKRDGKKSKLNGKYRVRQIGGNQELVSTTLAIYF